MITGVTVPPAIVGDRVIVGGRITEDMRTDMPAGVVRAFDARNGSLLWAWNSVPPESPGATPEGTYRRSTANTWSVFSVDAQRKLVFIPTGNAQVGLYGTTRDSDGRDFYASSVVALEAGTGKVVWHFQTVHHDVWDYDVPSQPVLFDFPTPAGPVAAVAQPTKLRLSLYSQPRDRRAAGAGGENGFGARRAGPSRSEHLARDATGSADQCNLRAAAWPPLHAR